ncbi:MAG: T9SS type A sorting domain-containing protein [Bacteroidetes bacterium]|nr:T9SS type A sorting domain-containing protein [Bacteroidota bacterium]
MKKQLLFILFIACVLNGLAQSQSRFLQPNSTANSFTTIQSQANAYFMVHPDTSHDGKKETYERWETFWQKRVGSTNPLENGTFLPAYKAAYAQMNLPICFNSGSYSANWVELGPGINPQSLQTQGIVNAVAFDPINSNIFYAGTTNSGLWKTSDGGTTWVCLTENLRLPGLGINFIAINPNNSNEIYIATGTTRPDNHSYGIGILKSTNAGLSWATTGLSFGPTIGRPNVAYKVVVSPNSGTNPSNTIVYAGVSDTLYKSSNGGATWLPILHSTSSHFFTPGSGPGGACADPYDGNSIRNIVDIEFKPTNPNIIYVSTNSPVNAVPSCYDGTTTGLNGGCQLFKSTDAGATFTELTPITTGSSALYNSNPDVIQADMMKIAVSPADSNSIFVAYGHTNNGYAYFQKSPDGGISWNAADSIPSTFAGGFGNYFNGFEVSPANTNNIYVGLPYMLMSTTGGSKWLNASAYNDYLYNTGNPDNWTHADVRAIAVFDNANSDMVLMGNDGGISLMPAGNPPWVNVGKTLRIAQFYGLGSSEKNSNLIIGGLQDNGIDTYNNGVWSTQIMGDAYDCVFDYYNPSIAYGETNSYSNNLYASSNGGASWGQITQPGASASDRLRPIENNAINNNIYIGYHDIYKFLYNGSFPSFANQWVRLSDFSSNFGKPMNTALSAIAVAPSNTNIIYVAYDVACGGSCNPPSHYFFRSTSGGGVSSSSWQDITPYTNAGEANVLFKWYDVTSIAINPNNAGELWLTVDGFAKFPDKHRVFHSGDTGTTWTDFSKGLPIFPANKIVYEKGSNDGLYVATDVGVYYRNKTMKQWDCFSDNLPVCMVSDLEINYASNTIRAATFGRGIWQSHLACPQAANINDNMVYNRDTNYLETKSNITSVSTIANNSTINYKAGGQVNLQPGFSVNANSSNSFFHAFIHNCNISGNSFRQNSGGQSNTDKNTSIYNNSAQWNSSIKEKNNDYLKIIPNPTTGTFRLLLNSSSELPKTISIFDAKGMLIKSINNPAEFEYNFNMNDLTNGLYNIIAFYSKHTESVRLVKF